MYGSPAMSKDLNLPFPSSPFKQGKEESDLQRAQQEQQMGSGLLRYRSAPGNVFGEVCEEFLPHRSSSPEAAAAESMFARFMAPDLRDHVGGEKRSATADEVAPPPQTGGFSPSGPPHMFFQTTLQHQQQQIPVSTTGAECGGSSSLVRHSSSPAGLFSHLNVENGFAGIRSMGGFRPPGGSAADAEAGKSSGRLKGQISFSSRQGSTGLMSQISEIGDEGIDGSSPEESGAAATGGGARCYIPGFPVASWEDSVLLSESFAGRKTVRDPSEAQNVEMRSHGPTLAHHFSLPKTSTEMVAMERFLQFQDAVPCKIRAKRGCATHPRSIAERVRRTRISERMRKLQELVPNMDKQTNTADMLDLAVDYIKDLQRQAKMLQDNRANCTCSHKQINQ